MKKRTYVAAVMIVLLSVTFGACSNNKPTAVVTEGETTILQNVGGTPADYSAKEVAYAAAGYLEKAQTYRVETTGSTRATKGMINYTQNISNVAIKNVDEAFAQSVSSSTFANVAHQSFVKKGVDKVVYRGAQSGDVKVQTTSEYRNLYGVIPGVDNLGGWVLNDDSILYGERKDDESSEDRHVYHYVLSKTLATGRMSVQMKAFGNLKDNAAFESVELTLVLKDDFTPVSLTSVSRYGISIAVLGSMSCTQELTAVYSDFGTEKEIPDAAAFNAAIGREPTHEIPVEPVENPNLEGLIGSLVEYDIAGGVALRGSTDLEVGGTRVSVPLEGAMKFDIASFDPADFADSLCLSISTEAAGVPLALHSLGDGKLYIDLGSTRSVFDLAELGLSLDPSALDFGTFVKIDKTAAGYRVAPSELALGMLNPLLADLGCRLDLAEIFFAVSGGRTSSIEVRVALADTAGATLFALDAEMLPGNKAYVAPDKTIYTERSLAQLIGNVMPVANMIEGFASYDWAQGRSFRAEVGLNIAFFDNTRIPIAIEVGVNPNAATLAELFRFRLGIDLSNEMLQAVFTLAGQMGMAIFPTDVNHIELYYTGDGNLYTVLGYRGTDADGVAEISDLIVSSTAIGDQLGSLLGNMLLGASLNGGTQLDAVALVTNLLFSFDAEVEANATVLRANAELLQIVNVGYASLIATLSEAAGPLGGLLQYMLAADFTEVSLRFATDADGAFAGVTLTLDAPQKINTDQNFIYRFELAAGDALPDGTFDAQAAHIAQLLTDAQAAAGINAYIDGIAYVADEDGYVFERVRLYDSVGDELDALKKQYADLTATQRTMVLHYDVLLAYRARYNELRASAQAFADTVTSINSEFTAWNELNAAYAALDADQLDYLGYLVDRYLTLRSEYERDNGVAALNTRLAALITAAANASSLADLDECRTELGAIRTAAAALLPESQQLLTDPANAETAIANKTAELLPAALANTVADVEAAATVADAMRLRATLAGLRTSYNGLPDTLKTDAATQAFTDAEAAWDAKNATLLNAEMTTLTAAIKACDATTTTERLTELKTAGQALDAAYKAFFDAAAKEGVTSYAAFAEVYPSTLEGWELRLSALDLNKRFTNTQTEYADANTVARLRQYYTALSVLNNLYNRFDDAEQALITARQTAIANCDSRMAALLGTAYTDILARMKTVAENPDAAVLAAVEALYTEATEARAAYGNFFDSEIQKTVAAKYTAFNNYYQQEFMTALYTLRAPGFVARVNALATEYAEARTIAALTLYWNALDALDLDSRRYPDELKALIAVYDQKREDCDARLVAALNAEAAALTAAMREAVAAEGTDDALTPDALAALADRGAYLVSKIDLSSMDSVDLDLRPSLVGMDAFLTIYRGAFSALIYTLA